MADQSLPGSVLELVPELRQAKMVVQGDLTEAGEFAERWFCLTDQWLYVVPAQASDVTKYLLAEMSELKCVQQVGSVTLLAVADGEERVLGRASQGRGRELKEFAKYGTRLIKGQEPDASAAADDEKQRCPKCRRLYPDPKRPVCPRCLDKRSLFLRVLALTPPYRWPIAIMILLMIVASFVGLAAPYLSGRIFFDQVIAEDGLYHGQVGQVVLAIFAAQLLTVLVGIGHGRVNAVVTSRIIFDLKTSVFAAMQRLSLRFYNQQQTGTLMTRVNSDANHLQYFFHDGIPYFIVNSLRLVGICAVLFWMDWQLAFLVLLPTPVIVYAIAKLHPFLWRMFSRRFRASSRLNSLVNDSLSGVRVVKAFGKEDEEIRRFSQGNTNVFDVSMQVGNVTTAVFPVISYIMGIGAMITWGVGGWRVVTGDLTFGTLISFTGYLGMFYGPLQFMTHIVEWWSSCMNSAQRIFEIVDSKLYLSQPNQPTSLPRIEGEVQAQGVHFAYEEGKPVLEEISFHVQPGEMIGLVGHSGAGKSTLINLIARLYDVDQGSLSIDGVDVRQIDEQDLRRQVGMVLQDTFLFSGTILENLAYARPDASKEEVIEVARIANAHDFITKLPDGYETIIGKRGTDLSGGERQRLSIARAILLNPRILILDEATSSIDTETELLIQEALEKLVQGRTTFAIAHRLSTLRKADRLFVFERGKIIETGTHRELMEQKSVYFKLITTQRKALGLAGVGG